MATARGADRKSKSSSPKIISKLRRLTQPDRELALYDGRIRLATIMYRERTFIVVLPSGVLLGTFPTLKLATAQISAAHGDGR